MSDRYVFGQENPRQPPAAEGEVRADYADAAIARAVRKAHFVDHRMFVIRQLPDPPDRRSRQFPFAEGHGRD